MTDKIPEEMKDQIDSQHFESHKYRKEELE